MTESASLRPIACTLRPAQLRPTPCPRCGGPLVPTRGGMRCACCHAELCVGCEGGSASDADDVSADDRR